MLLPEGGVESAFPPICIDIKSSDSKKNISFPTLIKEAFSQADEMDYLRTFKNKGYKKAYLYGFAFKGRNVQGKEEKKLLLFTPPYKIL